LTGVKAKMRFVDTFCGLLSTLEASNLTNFITLLESLQSFIRQAELLHQKLIREIPAKPSSPLPDSIWGAHKTTKIEKKMGKLWERGARMMGAGKKAPEVCPDDAYIPGLIAMLHQCSFLADWQAWFQARASTTPPQVFSQLRTIAAFLYHSVCSFILRDMLLLLKHRMATSRVEACQALPKGYLGP